MFKNACFEEYLLTTASERCMPGHAHATCFTNVQSGARR